MEGCVVWRETNGVMLYGEIMRDIPQYDEVILMTSHGVTDRVKLSRIVCKMTPRECRNWAVTNPERAKMLRVLAAGYVT